jgi:hypothetical protein
VLFGAATHDIGKIVHVDDLSGSGSQHEAAGQQLLLEAAVEPPAGPIRQHSRQLVAGHGAWPVVTGVDATPRCCLAAATL